MVLQKRFLEKWKLRIVSKKSKQLTALSLVLVILIQLMAVTYAADATGKLLDKVVTVKQNNVVILEEDWNSIDVEEAIDLAFSLRVPVQGDGIEGYTEDDYVKHGDTASFVIAKGFTLSTGAGPFDLSFGGKKVGTLTLISDLPTKTITASIVFDGDADIYNTDDWSQVMINFVASMEYDRTGNDVNGGQYTVFFLDKSFDVSVPALPVVFTGDKTGVRDGQFIDWKVQVKGTQGNVLTDLAGYTFKDSLSNVGSYVPGSFKTNTVDNKNTATLVDPDFTDEATQLTYTFLAGSTTEQFLFFRTKIDDDVFLSNGNKSITNTGKLYLGAEQVWTDASTVTFNVEWIKKVGAETSFNPVANTGEITWTITANQLGATLNNAIITDVLNSKLELVSAQWATYNGTTWDEQGPIIPDVDSKYSLGNITTPVKLTIITRVKADTYNIGHTIQTISNSATISWDGLIGGGIGSGDQSVNIGLNPIDKTAGSFNVSTHTIPWNVKIVKSDVAVDLRVMDLLVYSNSGFNVNNIGSTYSIEDNAANGLNRVTDEEFKLLTPNYNQTYKPGSFSTDDGLVLKVYTIKNASNVAVADLLVISDAGTTGIDVSLGNKDFSFETIVTNPNVYAKNGSTTVSNSASLWSANSLINKDNASVSYTSKILVKDMLTRTNADNADLNAVKNTAGASATTGFDYVDRTVLYRLHINANDIKNMTQDLTTEYGTLLGNVTLKDTLPAGWEFVEIEPGKMYKIYEGTGNNNGIVTAAAEPDDMNFISGDFTQEGVAEFTLTSLTKPYVIFLKAKPKEATLTTYFDSNKSTTPRNTAVLKAVNWSTGSSDFEDVTITSQLLSKSFVHTNGILTWTADYKPYEIEHTDIKMEDTIPQGIELRTNAQGVLDLTNQNITLTRLRLNADGSYVTDGNIDLVQGAAGNITYNTTTRVMTVLLPEDATDVGYRLIYKTDITGEPGISLNNSIKLIGSGVTSDAENASYQVLSADASATMTRSGWIEITKIDGADNALLSNAHFELRTANGTVYRSGQTGGNGKLIFRGLPIGEYTLLETTAPNTYNLDNTSFVVSVAQVEGVFTTSIDGKTGVDSNKLTLKNIKTGTVGTLRLYKNLSGNATSGIKEFRFTITIDNLDQTFNYLGHGGKSNGTLTFEEGVATITLKGGESISLLNVPKNSAYTIVEDNYNADGYYTTKQGDTGTIVADTVSEAKFINSRSVSNDEEKPPVPKEETKPVEPVVPKQPETPKETDVPKVVPPPSIVEVKPEIPTKEKVFTVSDEVEEIKVVTQPEHGTIVIDEKNNIIYTPGDTFTGMDKVVVVITQGGKEYTIEFEIVDDDIAQDALEELPKTGGVTKQIYVVLGIVILVMGIIVRKKV